MTKSKKDLHETALQLLEDINTELKECKQLSILNSLMTSVIKNLNDIVIIDITGQESPSSGS